MTTRTDTPMPDEQLPPDPDDDVSDPRPVMRPVHLRWRHLGLVALGGAVGTALRNVISGLLPADGGVSWSIFWINITGALLLEALAHRGPDAARPTRLEARKASRYDAVLRRIRTTARLADVGRTSSDGKRMSVPPRSTPTTRRIGH